MSGINIGDEITVRYSKKLERSGNIQLVNKVGIVTRLLSNANGVLGAYVDINDTKRIKNYYIPICSIEGPNAINRMRNLSILKTTIL